MKRKEEICQELFGFLRRPASSRPGSPICISAAQICFLPANRALKFFFAAAARTQGFYAAREDEQNAWLERMKETVEQSIEQCKERLENASNSWLLASAATLGQHSRGVLETLSHAAEELLRDTCADVFANLGETLRARLLGFPLT